MNYTKAILTAFAIPLMFTFFWQEGACQRGKRNKMTTKRTSGVQAGMWGGKHVGLEVTADGAIVQYDCANGTINQPITPDKDGRFDVKGTHVTERPGPARIGREDKGQPARYTGSVNETGMTLTVTLTGTNETVGTFTLKHGVFPQIVKCL